MRIPSWLDWYKKPEYRDIKEYSNAVVSGKRPVSPDGRGQACIPARLRLERVLENKTCSPMSLYDFYMYLKYIEFSPENLEFYVWFKNYEDQYKRGQVGGGGRGGGGSSSNGGSSCNDAHSMHSSTESSASLTKAAPSLDNNNNNNNNNNMQQSDPEMADTIARRITEMISTQAMCGSDQCKPPTTTTTAAAATTPFDGPPSPPTKTTTARTATTLNLIDAHDGRRAELAAVRTTFLQAGAEKELNIPPAMREAAVAALLEEDDRTAVDPTHLRPIADHVYLLLRNCSHRNFVRLGVANGTRETLCVATALGLALTFGGVLYVLLRSLVPHVGAHSRYDVFAAWPLWWLGLSLVLSGLRGSCFFLLLFTRRQPLPWERFDDSASILSAQKSPSRSRLGHALSRLMIFDRKLRVKDAHLRRLQHRIVVQSLVFGAFFSCVGVCIFIFLPVWKETVPGR